MTYYFENIISLYAMKQFAPEGDLMPIHFRHNKTCLRGSIEETIHLITDIGETKSYLSFQVGREEDV